MMFEAPQEVQQSPCPPSRPAAMSGPVLDLKRAIGATGIAWKATAKEQGNSAYLKNAFNNFPAKGFSTRIGYLSAAADVTKTDSI